jgi:hypothetical protein
MTAIINADNDACKVSFLLLASWTLLLVFLNRQLFNLQPASQPSFENFYYLQLATTSNDDS